MKAVQLYNICWNNILQKLFCKIFAFPARLLPTAISPPPLFLGAVSALKEDYVWSGASKVDYNKKKQMLISLGSDP